jgi:hypothetical protein
VERHFLKPKNPSPSFFARFSPRKKDFLPIFKKFLQFFHPFPSSQKAFKRKGFRQHIGAKKCFKIVKTQKLFVKKVDKANFI